MTASEEVTTAPDGAGIVDGSLSTTRRTTHPPPAPADSTTSFFSPPPPPTPSEGKAATNAVVVVGRTRCRDAAGYVGTVYFDGMIPTATTSNSSNDGRSRSSSITAAAADGTTSNESTRAAMKNHDTKIKFKQYYGVIWDDVTRGRHDGSAVNPTTGHLVRYMKVSSEEHENASHPTASSFVVPTKLDFGRPLSHSLLLERYVRKHRPDDTNWERHVVMCAGGNNDMKKTKPIELVGMDKIVSQQQVETLSTISMRFMGINHIPEVIFSNEEEEEEGVERTSAKDADHSDSDAVWSRRLRRCTHVDVAGNLLTDWHDLRRLLGVLPHLQNVSVAHNRFVDATLLTTSSSSIPDTAWSDKLTRLNVSKCNLRTSRILVELCRALPALESLCCAHADLRDIEATVQEFATKHDGSAATTTSFANVRELDVTSCRLTTAHLPSLSSLFPAVSTLNLTHNFIEAWPSDSVFAHLTHLQWTLLEPPQPISSDKETETKDSYHSDLMQKCLLHLVEAYHDQLISLRIDLTTQPYSTTSASSMSSFTAAAAFPSSIVPVPCKLLLIACLGRLELWNASHISLQERKDAEIYLLRHADRDGYPIRRATAPATTNEFSLSTPQLLIKCPRYDELAAKHPDTLQQAQTGGGDGTVGTLMNLVTVEFRSLCPHSCDRPPVIRKLPVTLTLGRLKSMLSRHFDLDADLQQLSWVSAASDRSTNDAPFSRTAGRRHDQTLPTPLNEHDDSTLEQCGLVHGAIVYMNEREISPREKENHRHAMLEKKIQQQEHELAEFERRKRALASGAVR